MFYTENFEEKMHTKLFRWCVNIFVILGIYCLAEIGRLIGIQGQALAISVFWPAAGFSLAALLLFGFRVWPAVFLGNFLYNFLHLYLDSTSLIAPFLTAFAVSTGSLLQGVLGAYIMRRFCSIGYFNTVKDIVVFLVLGGLLTCMIASTIGVTALYLGGAIKPSLVTYNWMTFWLGDLIGVYIVTPLLVVWTTQRPSVDLKEYAVEAFFMVVTFVVISLILFVGNYPLSYFYIPLSIWITYRFHLHGATLGVLLISLTVILLTVMGYGAIAQGVYASSPIFILVSLLEMNIATSLIFAAVINERQQAWDQLNSYSRDLEKEVNKHLHELTDMHNEIFIKEKLASMGMMTIAVAKKMREPFSNINDCINVSVQNLMELQTLLQSKRDVQLHQKIKNLEESLHRLVEYKSQAKQIIDLFQEEFVHSSLDKTSIKTINLHTLLNQCLDQLMVKRAKEFPEFAFDVVREFDRSASMISALPEDLAHAFMHVFNNSIYFMKEKKEAEGDSYEPILRIRTIDHPNTVEIIIRDNGMGVSKQELDDFFQSFIAASQSLERTVFGLALVHDIIVYVHHGEIKVESIQGQYLQITITLPKPRVESQKASFSETST